MHITWSLIRTKSSVTFKCTLKNESEVTQLCPTLCDPMNCSQPGSSIHGIFQARVLEWVAILFLNWTRISCITGRFFTIWDTREAQKVLLSLTKFRWLRGPAPDTDTGLGFFKKQNSGVYVVEARNSCVGSHRAWLSSWPPSHLSVVCQ